MPEQKRPALRVGVAIPAGPVPAFFAAAVRELLATGAELVALAVEDPAPARRVPRSAWETYQRLRPARKALGWEPVDLAAEHAGVPRVPANDLDTLRVQRLDVVLRWSATPPPPGLAELPPEGVWAFERWDELPPRGGPPGFWEIHDGAPATGAALLRLTGRPGEGVVLRSCFVSTKLNSHRTTLATIAKAMTHMPAAAARDLRLGSGPGPGRPRPSPGRRTRPRPARWRASSGVSRGRGCARSSRRPSCSSAGTSGSCAPRSTASSSRGSNRRSNGFPSASARASSRIRSW